MEETKKEQYRVEYEEFLNEYKAGVTDGSRVGEVISRLASHYTNINLSHAIALINFNNVAKEIECTVDEDSGKAISSSKAKVIANGTVESAKLIIAKAHLESVEQIINALKALQRGLINDYNNSGL